MDPNAELDQLISEVAELRPLPAVAVRALEIAEGEQFSAHELAQAISADQALTAKLLRLSNSAYYGFPRRITTVRDAVVLLGFRTVHQVALAACLVDNPKPLSNIEYNSFWQFSIATGLLAEILARTEGRHQDTAFTAGVLHNIGLLTLDQHRPQVLTEVMTRARQQSETLHQAERGLLGYTDADLGGGLALHWNFPDDLAESVRGHASLDAPPAADSLAAVVMRARIFARSYGLSDGLRERPDPLPESSEWAAGQFSNSLQREGGMDRILERADAFIAAALG